MDLRSWRKVHIQWVNECRFTEHNFITLEQSDIDAFFSIYVQKAQVAPVEEENALPTLAARLCRTSTELLSGKWITFGGYRCPSQALPPIHGCPQDAAGHHPFAVGRSPLLATAATVPSPPLGKLIHT
ncbi:uncharacterized protein [Drosophila suzukii]|uniref:Uncharacterized protein isoform X1 n=1 Tax=Drosophila suzukii TaxID=28584 RepID=A0ABM4TVL3_DROSZ